MMNLYELTYLIPGSFDEENMRKTQEKLLFLIQEKGILINSKIPKKIKLAYPIKKEETAFLGVANFQIKPQEIKDFEKKLKREVPILRYLLLKKKLKKAEKVQKEVVKKPKKPKKVELEKLEEKLKEIIGE